MVQFNISEIYKQAFAIIKKNKVLWVFGMALVAFTGGGGSSNISNLRSFFNSGGSSGKSSSLPLNGVPSEVPANISNGFSPVLDYLKNLFLSIPVSLWIGLGIGFLLLIILGLIISLVVSSWAKGAAIGAINDAYDNKPVTLRNGSQYGMNSLKKIIWLTLVPWLLYSLVFFVCIGFFGFVTFLLSKSALIFIPIIFLIILTIAAIVVSFGISISQIWAERIVVLEGKAAKEALFEGFQIAKKNLGNMLFLGSANCLLGCCLSGVVIGIIAALIGSGVAMVMINKNLGIAFLVIIGILFFILGLLSVLISGIIKIFNYTTWNIFYRKIQEEKNG